MAVLAVFLGAGVVAQLPHFHEGDWNHHAHSECPIYRLASQTPIPALFFLLLLFFTFLGEATPSNSFFITENRFQRFWGRAPPVR